MQDIGSYLVDFDDEFTTEGGGSPRRPDIDSLPNGGYTFEIADATTDLVGDENSPVLRVGLKVVAGPGEVGEVVERTYWLNNQIGTNILGQDLARLGFAVTKPSKDLMPLIKANKLIGIRFKAKKVVDKKGYAQLYVNELVGKPAAARGQTASSGRTPANGNGALNRQRQQTPPAQQPQEEFGGGFGQQDDEEIPF